MAIWIEVNEKCVHNEIISLFCIISLFMQHANIFAWPDVLFPGDLSIVMRHQRLVELCLHQYVQNISIVVGVGRSL